MFLYFYNFIIILSFYIIFIEWYINNYNYFILLCVFFILFLLFFMLLLLYLLCSRTSFLVLLLYDTSVKRSKSRSCLHDKAFELGTRQIWESSDLRSKSADFEYLEDCGSSVVAEQSGVSNEWQKTFWHSYHYIIIYESSRFHHLYVIMQAIVASIYMILGSKVQGVVHACMIRI